ncbi:DUF3718 domain-containing protein [Colwelliaceae bacterium 6441]
MNIKQIVVATLLTTGLSISAQASVLKAADHSLATDLCMTAASGNRAAMHSKMSALGASVKYITKSVQCNGENILAFVERHGKNSQNMLKILDRSSYQTTITDIAQNTIK